MELGIFVAFFHLHATWLSLVPQALCSNSEVPVSFELFNGRCQDVSYTYTRAAEAPSEFCEKLFCLTPEFVEESQLTNIFTNYFTKDTEAKKNHVVAYKGDSGVNIYIFP